MFDFKQFLNPAKNEDLIPAKEIQLENLPTLWLLGKTAAGKSSLIQSITKNTKAEIGSGFAPCTMTLSEYKYPQENPVMRFLDTRGLGESDYNPEQDIEEAKKSAQALIILMRADDPEQSQVLQVLEQIRKQTKDMELLLIHTAVKITQNTADIVTLNQKKVETVWQKSVTAVEVDFVDPQGNAFNEQELHAKLTEFIPILTAICTSTKHSSNEEKNFEKLKMEILGYAGTSAATDLLPVVGLVSVPAVQAKMIHSLAAQYGVEWNKRLMTEFISTLGTTTALQYSASLGLRQLQKLIPGYGQTVGAALSSAISFASTYAVGRAACYYLYHRQHDEEVLTKDLQKIYQQAFDIGKKASGNENK